MLSSIGNKKLIVDRDLITRRSMENWQIKPPFAGTIREFKISANKVGGNSRLFLKLGNHCSLL